MKTSTLGLFAVLLLGGCAEPVEQAEMVSDKSPVAKATGAAETPEVPSAVAESTPADAEVASPVDAAQILATTLAQAKADDKRVLVHLGATW